MTTLRVINVLSAVLLLLTDTLGLIIRNKKVSVCYGIDCGQYGTLDETSCKCMCDDDVTGHFCETELKTSEFPKGNYAILAALEGCPEDETVYGWEKGYINMTMESFSNSTNTSVRHYWSEVIHLLGPYHRHTLQLNFCSRRDEESVSRNSGELGASWPSGHYCVLKVGDACPARFTEGSFTLSDYVVNQEQYDGFLPGVNFTSEGGVTVYFCCHSNANYGTENKKESRSFGKSFPFILFHGPNKENCTDFPNLDSTKEMFAFRKTRNMTWHSFGSTPSFAEDDDYFNITFCYYKPIVGVGCMYMIDKGGNYRGNYSMTKIGKRCDYWSIVEKVDTRHAADLESNFCRKITKLSRYPICYVKGFLRSCPTIPLCDDRIENMDNVALYKPVDSSPGFVFKPDSNSYNKDKQYQTNQLVVNGAIDDEKRNFRISVPVAKPYFKIDLGYDHLIYGVLIHRLLVQTDAETYWERMAVWIDRNEWDFVSFGATMCGGMVNAHKNDYHLFKCDRPITGRYVILQTNIHSDPDVVLGEYLNLQLNEIQVLGKETNCGRILGLMTGTVTYSQITTSSFKEGFHSNQSRLNGDGPCWCPDANDKTPFIKVHLLLPMVVEGLIIQGWKDESGALHFPRSFKVIYGFDYDDMDYYSNSKGRKIYYTSSDKGSALIHKTLFSNPFLASIVGLEIPAGETSCLKLEWIVCKREVNRNCADVPVYGLESLPGMKYPLMLVLSKYTDIKFTACLPYCRRSSLCQSFEYNEATSICHLYDVRHFPPFQYYDLEADKDTSVTYKLCLEESKELHQNLSAETLVSSPNYPFYYGDNKEYTWDVHINDAVAIKVDILDIHIPARKVEMTIYDECFDEFTIHAVKKRSDLELMLQISSEEEQKLNRGSRNFVRMGNHLFIKLRSCAANRDMPYRGFNIKVSKSDCGGCFSTTKCSASCGYLQSYFFPVVLSLDRTGYIRKYLLTTISADIYDSIKIQFTYYDVPHDAKHFIAYLNHLPDGSLARTNLIGDVTPYPVLYSMAKTLTLVFFDVINEHKIGYQLRYNFVRMYQWEKSVFQMNRTECEHDWMYFNGSCYYLAKFTKGTFLESRTICKNLGGDLAVITSMEESNAINYYLVSHRNASTRTVVFGLRAFAEDNEYKWVDGSKAVFQNWQTDWTNINKTNPNLLMTDSCVVLRIQTSRNSSNWIMKQCRTDYSSAICEKSLKQEDKTLLPVYLGNAMGDYNMTALRKATFMCSDGSLIDRVSKCDRRNDCLDHSDEIDCNYEDSVCGEHEFQCEDTTDLQCIPMTRYCDFIHDCKDQSDERSCIRPDCMIDQFRCANGQCVSNIARCDIKVDCLDGSDEMNCEDVDCTVSGKFFKCGTESLCIPLSKVCDGFVDCPDKLKSDENGCQQVMVKESCEKWYADGFRQSGTYMIDLAKKLAEGITDGWFPVECEFDEISGVISTVIHHIQEASIILKEGLGTYEIDYDPALIRIMNPNQNLVDIIESFGPKCSQRVEVECFQAPNIDESIRIIAFKRVPLTSCRLYKQDCLNRVGVPLCNVTGNRCQCLLSKHDWLATPSNKWFKDVFVIDNSDYIPIIIMRNRGAKYPGQRSVAIGPLVCNSTMVRTSSTIKCNNGKVVPASLRCLYNVDVFGSVTGCRDNTHLLDCEIFVCPYGFVKCPNSYCIPMKSVCDGRMDCRHGDDEFNCYSWTCPKHYRCRDSKICIPLNKVCDEIMDCSLGDDETNCDYLCPSFCTCIKGGTDCNSNEMKFKDLTGISKNTRKLNLSYNQVVLNDAPSFFDGFDHLAILGLAHCRISELPGHIFLNLKNLQILDLSFNRLVKIAKRSLSGLENLRELKLQGNKFLSNIAVGAFRSFKLMTNLDLSGLILGRIAGETFIGMTNLESLNMSYNKINTIENNAFKYLRKLKKLDIKHNEIISFGKDSFAGLDSLSFLYTDSFMFCCIKPSSVELANCHPPSGEFSSCSDLMRNEELRVLIWFIGIFAFFGNILSLVFRFLSERETFKCGYGILVTNLSIADMLMGVYLLIISIADVTYRGRYIWNDVTWRKSTYCSFAGGLAIVSIESSVLLLTLITFDRFKSIKFMKGYNAFKAIISCVIVWFGSITVAIIPVLPLRELENYFGESFYSVSGVCLTLPLTTERLSGWSYSAGVLIVFNFLCFVCIAVGQSIIYVTVSGTKIMLESPDRRIEFQAAKRLSTIVITDFLAWFPVCALGANALYGGTVSGAVYTWIAVFVMPLKSALNPILFTYSTFSNSQLGRRILNYLGFQTTRFSTGRQAYLKNVHQIYKMRCLVLHKEKNHQSLKEHVIAVRNVPITDIVVVTARMALILDKIHDMELIVGRFGNDHVLIKPDTTKAMRRLVIKGLPRELKDDNEKSTNMCDFGNVIGWMLKRYNVQKLRMTKDRGHAAPDDDKRSAFV